MAARLKHILAQLAVILFTLGAEAHESAPSNPGIEAMYKICRDIWAGLAGACGTVAGYVEDFDLMFWLGVALLMLTIAERCYQILIHCRRYRGMGAKN